MSPMIAANYPANWPEISARIRARAGNRCEWIEPDGRRCEARHGDDRGPGRRQVVLTVAHLDHNTWNNSEANLAALCERHHLAYDSADYRRRLAAARQQAALAAGQLTLPLEV